MNSATFDNPREGDSNRTRARTRELASYRKRLVSTVIAAYTVAKELPVLCAVDVDRDSTSHSQRWTPQVAHFKADVEHATTEALADDKELQATWFSMSRAETVDLKLEREVVARCSRFYEGRGLDPHKYFTKGKATA